jgi:hypothetical protein
MAKSQMQYTAESATGPGLCMLCLRPGRRGGRCVLGAADAGLAVEMQESIAGGSAGLSEKSIIVSFKE